MTPLDTAAIVIFFGQPGMAVSIHVYYFAWVVVIGDFYWSFGVSLNLKHECTTLSLWPVKSTSAFAKLKFVLL